MMKRVAGITVVALAAGLAAASTVSAGTTARQIARANGVCTPKMKVGVVDLIAQSPIDFKTSMMAVATAKKLGWDVQFVDAAGDPAKAQVAIQSFVTQKYDLIINTSVDAAPIRSALQAAKAANIPVFETAAGNKSSDLFAGMYNEDETTMGRILMEYIVKTVPNAKVSNLTTRLNYAGLLRDNAIRKVVAATGGKAEIVASTEVDLTNAVVNTTKIVTDHITAHPDVNAVYAVFDNMAAAAINAVRAKGSTAGVYSYFSTAANLKFLRSKSLLKAVADANLPLGAVVAFDQFLKWKINKTPIDRNALKKLGGMTYKIVDQANVPATGEVFSNVRTLAPFWAKWQKAYPC